MSSWLAAFIATVDMGRHVQGYQTTATLKHINSWRSRDPSATYPKPSSALQHQPLGTAFQGC